ncbi:putative permease [Thioflavicoccus mobilis 8321]|uniref:Putative permease n=1 Tax=Thioflavicoccus mobilis 8321 TaxID=765912 RepID=L0GSP1_9GAMM|nr:AI-2E family transporter [Thioflavicoccus mobilis]AGA88991.1 putative permease [Thioflavicoccus mobilis 8321]
MESSPAARFLLNAAALVVVIAGMRAAAPLLTPFLLAVFIAIVASPPLLWLKRRRLPLWAALLVVLGGLVGIGALIASLLSTSLDPFMTTLPDAQARLKELTLDLLGWLDSFGLHLPREALATYIDPSNAMGIAGDFISGVGGVLGNAALILLTVFFILLEAAGLPAKLTVAMKTPETTLTRLRRVLDNVNRYMMIKTTTSIATGLLIWLWLSILGVNFAVLWGLVAFLFNFVPTIGSFVAAAPAVLLVLVQMDLETVLLVTVGYVLVNGLIGNYIEPKYMGRGVGLSTLIVFSSLVFWGWVLGPVGMFLSVPLTMALKIALEAYPDTRPIAVLLGPEVLSGSRFEDEVTGLDGEGRKDADEAPDGGGSAALSASRKDPAAGRATGLD